jgi:hypothetical protein
MMIIHLKFRCDYCGKVVEHDSRVGSNIIISRDQFPENWEIVSISESHIKLKCYDCVKDHHD